MHILRNSKVLLVPDDNGRMCSLHPGKCVLFPREFVMTIPILDRRSSIFMLCRAINPVVVAPTVTAVGLAFFAYGFPVVGTCVEIGIPQFLVVVFFALVSKHL